MTQKTEPRHPKVPAATTTSPAAPQELQPLKRWSYPFAPNNSKAAGPQPYLAALGSAEDGSYPLGANGIWHGGIHFDHSTDAMLKQGDGVGVIADGEIVAYRLDRNYPELDYPDKKIAHYSTSFVLVRHKLLLPPAAQLSGSSTSSTQPSASTPTPASGAPGKSQTGSSTTAAEPPVDDVLEFYSLYMHLLDYAHYESAEKDASTANKAPAVQRMSYWQGDRHFVVGAKAKDQQVQPVDPMDEYFGNGLQDEAPPGADDEDTATDTPPVTGTHIRNAPKHGKVLGILPRGSEITIVGTATDGYARIDKVLSGAPVAETVGDDVPVDAATGWVFIGELDSKIIPNPLDSVVVLSKPFPVNAGDKVGYLGQYQRYRDASRLPPTDSRPLLHLEVFAGDKLKSFVDRCRDRCNSVGDKLQKPMLVVSTGARLVPGPSDPDKTIDKGLKLVPVKGAPTGSLWVKVQPTRMPATTATHGHAQAHHAAGSHQPAGSPTGTPLWVDSSMSGKNADGIAKGWSNFPLQLSSASGPAATYQDVFTPAELQQLDSVQDDQQRHWWKITVGTGKGESTTGWVCGKGHPDTAWQSPWQWPGFEIVDNTSISIVDSFKRAVYVSKELFETEEEEFKPSALGVNGSDLITKLEKAIDHDGNGTITAAELRAAQGTAWLAEALSHLIVRYESEWGGSMDKWDQLSALMKDHKELWQSELQRIEKLQWWSKATGVKNFPSSPVVHHMHPIGLIGNFASKALSLEEARVRAFLRMIRVGEGTEGEAGYERLFGGESFIKNYGRTFADHPRLVITKTNRAGKTLSSSAAGAYQVMGYTWDDPTFVKYRQQYGIADFTPSSQDRFCVILLRFKRHALDDIKKGDVKKAIFDDGCNNEWASLPGDVYGQGGVGMNTVNQKFSQYFDDEMNGTSDLAVPIGGLDDLIL